jgi:hypothetical protein
MVFEFAMFKILLPLWEEISLYEIIILKRYVIGLNSSGSPMGCCEYGNEMFWSHESCVFLD